MCLTNSVFLSCIQSECDLKLKTLSVDQQSRRVSSKLEILSWREVDSLCVLLLINVAMYTSQNGAAGDKECTLWPGRQALGV